LVLPKGEGEARWCEVRLFRVCANLNGARAVLSAPYSECTAAAAIATLYMMPVTACQNGSGNICSALIGTTMVSPGWISTLDPRLNQRLLPSLATTLPSARTT